jgi:rhamnulokinase
VGWRENGELKTEEVYRFPNGVREENGHLIWDAAALLGHVKAGIGQVLAAYPRIESLSVDTWGCDYVLLDGDREILPCYAYRDHRTEAIHEAVHAAISFPELYRRTGCQFQLFNTIYQLCADKAAGRLENATDFLMVPEYLMYKLTGVKAKEYTNATTTGLVNAETGEFDREILARLGLPSGSSPGFSSRARRSAATGASAWSSAPPTTPAARWRAFPWRAMKFLFPPAPGACWG